MPIFETFFLFLDGVEMQAEIFFGIIHYQRLRHMVSDKFQVRSVGTVDQVTRQPIKGQVFLSVNVTEPVTVNGSAHAFYKQRDETRNSGTLPCIVLGFVMEELNT